MFKNRDNKTNTKTNKKNVTLVAQECPSVVVC